MTHLLSYFRSQAAEICDDTVLRRYGIMLALVPLFSVLWWAQNGATDFLSQAEGSICWPVFESCYSYRFSSPASVWAAFGVLSSLALITIGLFRAGKAELAWLATLALLLGKLVLFVLDFRMRGNHHYMAFLATAFFLFVPQKRRAIPYLIISFYMTAALLKLNVEWLSGGALSADGAFAYEGKWVEWACAYVVFLELIVVWGLLARRNSAVFRITLLQFVAFHLFSLPVVSWFYPVVMACVNSVFLFRDAAIPRPRSGAALGALGIYWLLHLLPYSYGNDTGLSGEGRFLALNMMDVRSICTGVLVKKKGASRIEEDLPVMQLPVRIWCHPLVFYNYARAQCREGRATGAWDEVDFQVLSRRSGDEAWQLAIRAANFCTDTRRYPLVGKNPWIP